MSLESLLSDKTVYKVAPDKSAVAGLISAAHKDLETAAYLLKADRFDWAFSVAYNAMLRSGRAYMLSLGYRPSTTNGHVAVMKFLKETLHGKAYEGLVISMDRIRKKRHQFVYEEPDIVPEGEAKSAIAASEKFVKTIESLV